jgi:hypothetical protein
MVMTEGVPDGAGPRADGSDNAKGAPVRTMLNVPIA